MLLSIFKPLVSQGFTKCCSRTSQQLRGMCDAVNKAASGTTPLRKSRPPKIKSLDSDESAKKFLEVTAYSAADQFNLSSIKERIDDLRGQFVFQRLSEVNDAISFTSKLSSDASRIFV